MKLTGIYSRYLPILIARVWDLVDVETIRKVLVEAIEKLESIVKRTENRIDDQLLLPLLRSPN